MSLNILDWTEIYLKYKDSTHRQIKNMTKNKEKQEIICELKNGSKQVYLCKEELEGIGIDNIKNKRITCLNTKKNLNWLLNNWQEIKEINTQIIFANPKKASHWSINPKLHEGITGKTNIKTGLKTLFDSTPEV